MPAYTSFHQEHFGQVRLLFTCTRNNAASLSSPDPCSAPVLQEGYSLTAPVLLEGHPLSAPVLLEGHPLSVEEREARKPCGTSTEKDRLPLSRLPDYYKSKR